MTVHLIRSESSDFGTFGALCIRDDILMVGELPWKDNQPNISCIPTGTYACDWVISPRFGGTYQVLNVPGRSHILFHVGNFVGDREKGLRSDSDGCIVVGTKLGMINGQRAVLNSRVAMGRFIDLTRRKPFKLIVSGMDIW